MPSMCRLQMPAWLTTLLANRRPPPKLYAWTTANLDSRASPAPVSATRRNGIDERIFILGVGNIGRLYACGLAITRLATPVPITLVVHKRDLLTQWQERQGIRLIRHGMSVCHTQFDMEWWTEARPERGPVREVADGGKLRNLFISTKTLAAMPEVDRIRRYLDKTSSVVFAQNGVSKLWPPHGPLYVTRRYEPGTAPSFSACVINHGLFSTGKFESNFISPADAAIGPLLLNPESPPSVWSLPNQIAAAPLLETKSVSSGELWLLQLEKLVVNSTINPLTAILRCPNGHLFSSEDTQKPLVRIRNKLLAETSDVLQALISHESSAQVLASCTGSCREDVTTDSHDRRTQLERVKRDVLDRFSLESLQKKLHAIGIKVGGNRSSMLQDVEAGRETEIRDFNGWIVDTAAFLGKTSLNTATHQRLIELVESGAVLDDKGLAEELLC